MLDDVPSKLASVFLLFHLGFHEVIVTQPAHRHVIDTNITDSKYLGCLLKKGSKDNHHQSIKSPDKNLYIIKKNTGYS